MLLSRDGSSAEMRGALTLGTVQLRAEHRGADDATCVVALVRRGAGTRSSLTDPVTGSKNPRDWICSVEGGAGRASRRAARDPSQARPVTPGCT